MEKVKVHQVVDNAAFEFVANILRDASIPFYKMSADAGGAFSGAIGGVTEIYVDKENEEKANSILSEFDLSV